jgi:hypothetical protein
VEEEFGFESLEEAARGDIPERYVTVLGSLVVGDQALVWVLTNDRPPYEPYEVDCERRDGRWYNGGGTGGFGTGTPEAVLAAARRLGWS